MKLSVLSIPALFLFSSVAVADLDLTVLQSGVEDAKQKTSRHEARIRDTESRGESLRNKLDTEIAERIAGDHSLQLQIDSIELMLGPTGPKGDAGPVGP